MTHDSQPQIDESFKQNEDAEACRPAVEEPEWKASKEVFQVLFCLSIIGIMASLDMTIFLPILPVSTGFIVPFLLRPNRGNSLSPRILTAMLPARCGWAART